jgi:lipopolysaccharide export system permease protein
MHFFPSRNIALYMAKLFVVRSFAVLAMLVLIRKDFICSRQ